MGSGLLPTLLVTDAAGELRAQHSLQAANAVSGILSESLISVDSLKNVQRKGNKKGILLCKELVMRTLY